MVWEAGRMIRGGDADLGVPLIIWPPPPLMKFFVSLACIKRSASDADRFFGEQVISGLQLCSMDKWRDPETQFYRIIHSIDFSSSG